MSRASEYANSVSSLYAQIGEARAREAANKGAIWSGALANIGDFVAQYPQRKAQMEEMKTRAETLQLQREREARLTQKEKDESEADAKLRDLFASGQQPSVSQIITAVGPQRGVEIAKGLKALQESAAIVDPRAEFEKTHKVMRDVLLGMNALPESMRAESYPGVRAHLVEKGIIKAEDAPEAYDPAWWTSTMNYGQEPSKAAAPKTAQITTLGADGKPVTKFVEETPGAEYPQVPKESEITPYQKEELIRRDKEIALSQQRLALAVKQANKPAIAKESTGLVDAVIANPVLWGQLTPTAKQTIAPELQKRGFTAFNKPPSATVENRLASAQAVTQTGNDIIGQLSDPKVRGMLGPAMGRYNSVREFIGNPPPELSDLAASIESFALANMGVHGMRSVEGANEIKALLDRKHTPDSLIKTIQGLNRFSQHFLQNEDPKRLPSAPAAAPAGGAPAVLSYQDYLKSKGGK